MFTVFLVNLNKDTNQNKVGKLVLFCAAGMQPAVMKIIDEYEKEYSVKIEAQYGGSGTLLSQMRTHQNADLYLAADYSYIELAREYGLIEERIPVLNLAAGLVVEKGNPKNIKSIKDVLKHKNVKLCLANPEAASVGKFTKKILKKNNVWNEIDTLVKKNGTYTLTVNELANHVKLKSMDAGIVWDAVAGQYEELEWLPLPEFEKHIKETTIAITKKTSLPTQALHFARYLTAKEKGLKLFKQYGYKTVEGDTWSSKPELEIFSGGMLRPAIEKSLKEFSKREGISINTVYNGCGILVAKMKAGAKPDLYYSCDTKFMDDVQDMFYGSRVISKNDMVIAIPNSKKEDIKSVEDLMKKGVQVGLAHPDKSALGFLTKELLKELKLYEKIKTNVVTQAATGDFLINQIALHSLDAVIVYRSNFMASPSVHDICSIVEIKGADASATQPYAVSKTNPYPRLSKRLTDFIHQRSNKFIQFGFQWVEAKQ